METRKVESDSVGYYEDQETFQQRSDFLVGRSGRARHDRCHRKRDDGLPHRVSRVGPTCSGVGHRARYFHHVSETPFSIKLKINKLHEPWTENFVVNNFSNDIVQN